MKKILILALPILACLCAAFSAGHWLGVRETWSRAHEAVGEVMRQQGAWREKESDDLLREARYQILLTAMATRISDGQNPWELLPLAEQKLRGTPNLPRLVLAVNERLKVAGELREVPKP
jgi:hypothetical protein